MRRHITSTTARSPRRLVRLAAAVTGLTARPAAAAETPVVTPPVVAKPSAPPVRHYYQTWAGLTASGTVVHPLVVFVDLGSGFYPDMRPLAFYVRPALGLQLPHGFSVHAGYTYASFWGTDRRRSEEHVAFEQVAYKAPIPEVDLSGRVRVEQRFHAGSDVGHRLRTSAQVNVPFWRRAPLELVLWDELFLGLNQPAPFQPELLDLNMLFVGLGWQPGPHFRTEVGYQGTVVPRRDETALIHALSVGVYALW